MLYRAPRTNRFILAALLTGFVAAPAWGQVINEDRKLLASDGAADDWFGQGIAIDNGIVVVGAYRDDDNGTQSGSAYLFNASTGAQIAKLLPTDGAEQDWFGFSIAIDNGVVVVGALLHDENGTDSGSAYVFDLCPADIDGDGDLDSKDFFAYLELFASGDDRADIDGDGDIDAKDFFGYLDLFVQGC